MKQSDNISLKKATNKILTQPVGIIGAGSFGTAIANLLAENVDVMIYARNPKTIQAINIDRRHKEVKILDRIRAVKDLQTVAQQCQLIFPIVPASNFRMMMRDLSPHLTPAHFLIHGTKGLDTTREDKAQQIFTISEIIAQESTVRRIGCLSGPNISKEILAGQPAATVIASHFREVIDAGFSVLRSSRMQVYSSRDIRGAELAGALKNIIAIAAGILNGLDLGKNMWGLLITRGLTEMIHFGKALGADVKPFLGVAGIGDLITTASSVNSRNFTVGRWLAKGKSLEEIKNEMEEVAEGVHTVRLAKSLADQFKLQVPITRMVYRILYANYSPVDALDYLIGLDYEHDVDYL